MAAVTVVGCGDDDDEEAPSGAGSGTATKLVPEAKKLVSGWYKDREVKYFDLGMNTKIGAGGALVTAPIWAFAKGTKADGSPDFVQGQKNVIDVLPGEAGYSDLWQVSMVSVPADYKADTVKSKADIDKAKYKVAQTQIFVNCPVVAEGTTLEGGQAVVQGWAKGKAAFYPDFGPNVAASIPIWVFIKGMKSDGTPDFFPGQNNIIDAVQADAGYSAFWRVNLVTVPGDYKANTIKSAAGVTKAGYAVKQTDLIVNCPVVGTPAAAAATAETKKLVSGFYKDKEVKYYDFGANTRLAANGSLVTAPIWAFIKGKKADGSPDFVVGQKNVIDVLPGQSGYSDLWQVSLVTVPADYKADAAKSKADIDGGKFAVEQTQMFVNCPVVPEGTKLEGGQAVVQGWAKGNAAFYPDFGGNVAASIPIWVFIKGMKSDGTPDFVQGQGNVIDAIKTDPGYSAFWRVNLVTVPADYKANTIKSAGGVVSSGYTVKQTDMIVNCPVV